jgi:beta-lactam-binding protein with PASTA domain
MISVVGDTEADARNKLYTLEPSLSVTVTRREDSVVAAGKVISQTPLPGASIKSGERVSLLISTGPPIPPPSTDSTPPPISNTPPPSIETSTPDPETPPPAPPEESDQPPAPPEESDQPPAPPEDTTKPVPDVFGMTYEAARNRLITDGFTRISRNTEKATQPDDPRVGTIISQNPGADTRADPSTTTVIITELEAADPTLTPPPTTMKELPNVINMDETAAKSMLNQAGFTRIEVSYDTTYDSTDNRAGKVTSQFPGASPMIDINTEIIITVLKIQPPPQEATLPSVTGQKLADAKSTLRRNGFLSIEEIHTIEGSETPGTVISQNPSPSNTKISTGTKIFLTVRVEPTPAETEEE